MDFERARRNMVESQVRTADVIDLRLQQVMLEIPREVFVPSARKQIAYMDGDVETEEGRAMMSPRTFSRMVQALAVKERDVILAIAPGTGYSVAVLARLGSAVVGLEDKPALVKKSGQILSGLGIDNAAIVEGDLTKGCPDQAPFDVIFIDGAVDAVPQTLFDQLADGGRLAVILRDGSSSQACLFTKTVPRRSASEDDGKGGKALIDRRVIIDAFGPMLAVFERKREFSFNFG